jgi:hypothetical protein
VIYCELCGGPRYLGQERRRETLTPECQCESYMGSAEANFRRDVLRRLGEIERTIIRRFPVNVRRVKLTLMLIDKSATLRIHEALTNQGEQRMNAVKLVVGGVRAVLTLLDAAGAAITAAAFTASGGTIVVVSANPQFATVAATSTANGGDGVTMYDILPVDPTAETPGSSVISFTATNEDDSQAVGTLTVADTDDVATISVTATPIVAPAAPAAKSS